MLHVDTPLDDLITRSEGRQWTATQAAKRGLFMGQPVVHFEIIGTDPEKLRSYYSDLFGWEFERPSPVARTRYPSRRAMGSWTSSPRRTEQASAVGSGADRAARATLSST
jgi:hypothetical protein